MNNGSPRSKQEACFALATQVWLPVNHNNSVTSGEWIRSSKRNLRASELGRCQSNFVSFMRLWTVAKILRFIKDLLWKCKYSMIMLLLPYHNVTCLSMWGCFLSFRRVGIGRRKMRMGQTAETPIWSYYVNKLCFCIKHVWINKTKYLFSLQLVIITHNDRRTLWSEWLDGILLLVICRINITLC